MCTRPADKNGLGLAEPPADSLVLRLEASYDFIPDTEDVYAEWKSLVFGVGAKGRQVHDARLAAMMKVLGINRILTFNGRDFVEYPDIVPVDPASLQRLHSLDPLTRLRYNAIHAGT
jgi:predicted nucleic acid-binding protein